MCLVALASPMALPVSAAKPVAVDAARSQASFSVQLRIIRDAEGRFGRMEGELLPAGDGQWQVRVRIDARDIRFDGPDWLARVTRSESFLDVQHHPKIEFESEPFPTSLLAQGGDLSGWLRLRGQRRAVVLAVAPGGCPQPGYGCAIEVGGEVSRREFGMTTYRFALRDPVGLRLQVRLAAPLP